MASDSVPDLNRSGVYQILNLVNGKRYIGSAKCLYRRFHVHRRGLMRGLHHCRYLQAAWNKYGESAFRFEPLLICSAGNAVFYEQRAIDAYAPEYNIAKIAGSCLGVRHSEETRAKRSLLNMGNKFGLGRPPSERARAAVAAANRRRKGFKRSPQAIAASAAAHRGMKRSEETRAKIAAKARGRKYSAETIEKRAAKIRGVKLSPEHVAHLIGNKHAAGVKPTPEANARRSAALKAAWAEKKALGIPWR